MPPTTNSQILNEINQLSVIVRETNQSVIRLEEQMKPMCKDIDRLKKTIYGENGDTIGLSESLRSHSKKLDNLIENHEKEEADQTKTQLITQGEYVKFKYGLIAGIVLLLLNFLSDIVRSMIGG